ncbi:protease complex subunit PrcB family protein [Deinococcus sp. YIM 77859]|uniref:protease complex subunit PrcB family protein n=1 Tax=Deinococcus sp. YIM 77859 TaxID=1540221 RepID=UPI00054DBCFB|nr:protease complex subunit PrcB family protein [Deinococcus sp. YIM 77859]
MNKILTAALLLSAGLLAGCSLTGPGELTLHEVLLYGGAQERLVWVYGNMGTGTQSSVKLGGTTVDLRAQVPDPLAVPGTLSVNGKAVYRLPTASLPPKLSVTRDTQGRFQIAMNEAGGSVYYTDGRTWTRLNETAGSGVSGTPVRGLRGAGNLTDAEADALSAALLNQGALAVAVLNETAVPDPPLTTEPAPREYRRTALYVLPGVPTVAATSGTAPNNPPAAGGRVTFTELASGNNASVTSPAVQVATTQGALAALYNLAYGRQTSAPPVPPLGGNATAVAIFLGQRATGGYGVRVTGASAQGGVLTLTVNLTAPGPGSITTQALTSPWTIVRVPGTYREVRVVDTQGRPFQLGPNSGQTR